MWLSVLQGAAPLGVMIGYSTAGYLANYGFSWRYTIMVQVCLLGPFALGSFWVPGALLNMKSGGASSVDAADKDKEQAVKRRPSFVDQAGPIGRRRSSIDAQAMHHVKMTLKDGGLLKTDEKPIPTSTMGQLKLLLSTPTFVFCTLALSALFFVVTGIQFWATDFLIKVIEVERSLVLGAFAATSATAPVLGVVFGGWIVDYFGGYNGPRGCYRTSLIGTVLGTFAVALALPAGFFKNFWLVLGCVWLVLFFGGAIVPGATGMVISSVDPRLKAFSSAMSMLTYNVLGYSAGTIIPGGYQEYYVARGYSPTDCLAEGFRLVLWWSVWGWLFMALSTCINACAVAMEGDEQPGKEASEASEAAAGSPVAAIRGTTTRTVV